MGLSISLLSPLSASVSEDGKASLQSDSSHCGCQGGCQEQPLASFALLFDVYVVALSLPLSPLLSVFPVDGIVAMAAGWVTKLLKCLLSVFSLL